MRVVVGVDSRFLAMPDGGIVTPTVLAYSFWKRYLEIFEEVIVAARVRTALAGTQVSRVTGPGVRCLALPDYQGPIAYAGRHLGIVKIVRGVALSSDAVIIRAPSQVGNTLFGLLGRSEKPFGVELCGDPHSAFSPGAVRHVLRPLWRQWFTWQTKRQCGAAAAVCYVTGRALQERYPCRGQTFSASDVELEEDWFAGDVTGEGDSWSRENRREPSLLFVGSLEQMYKGLDLLLDALVICRGHGIKVTCTVVGDGCHRCALEKRARSQGLGESVRFLGTVGCRVCLRELYRNTTLFVLPSRAEGLPRVLIEAMACGTPCIGSLVGGIPELLAPEDCFRPNDAVALAAKIREILTKPERRAEMSRRNRAIASQYSPDQLKPRWRAFHEAVRTQTANWLARKVPLAS